MHTLIERKTVEAIPTMGKRLKWPCVPCPIKEI